MMKIPFNKPGFSGKELAYIKEAVARGHLSGNGYFTKKCHQFFEKRFRIPKVLLTTSCTSALEMAGLLVNLKPGDEVILPSYTFVSSANAFVLRGAVPRFVDIRPDTFNIDETKIASVITKRTKAVIAVHYAGVAAEMDAIQAVARKKNIPIVEDAAQAVDATYRGRFLGTLGDLGAYSFHETKNCMSGEGGALLINRKALIPRAEIIWEKGTNRCQFFRGEVDKYTWVDVGSSFLPSELVAAFLYAQLTHLGKIKEKRKKIYNFYTESLSTLAQRGEVRLPIVPKHCHPNYHMYYLLFSHKRERNRVMAALKKKGILAIFHYIPLHLSPMGKRFGYQAGDFPITEDVSERILRLPLYNDLTLNDQKFIVKTLKSIIS